MKKIQRKRRNMERLKRANEANCRSKKTYRYIEDAWDHAELYYIKYGTLSIPYKCCLSTMKNHYHLTSQTGLGDMTHIPEDKKELFATFPQPQPQENFWSKLRRILCG